jgi:hypothetical protein
MLVLSVIGFGHTGGGATRWLALGYPHSTVRDEARAHPVARLFAQKKREKMKASIQLPHF